MPTTKKQPKAKPAPAPVAPPAAEVPTIEPSAAEAAYQSLAPQLEKVPRDQLLSLTVDAQTAAVFALGVARFAQLPAVRPRFANLAKSGEYDDSCVDTLAAAAQCAWYARHAYLLDTATRSTAQVPPDLLDAGYSLRSRLFKLIDYWLGADPTIAGKLNAIKAGSGHQDLANDLVALAALCDQHTPTLSQDKNLYRSTDAKSAKQIASRVLEHLGDSATAEQGGWSLAQQRAWTHLNTTYEEVRRGGRFLFPGDEGETRFPSLVTVARAAARGAKGGELTAPTDESAPTPAAPTTGNGNATAKKDPSSPA